MLYGGAQKENRPKKRKVQEDSDDEDFDFDDDDDDEDDDGAKKKPKASKIKSVTPVRVRTTFTILARAVVPFDLTGDSWANRSYKPRLDQLTEAVKTGKLQLYNAFVNKRGLAGMYINNEIFIPFTIIFFRK